MTARPTQSLIYAGIDEAGYGPRLGPLCVGMSALRIQGVAPGADRAPDLWDILSAALCREPGKRARGRIAVNDSKLLKLPNSSKGAGPLAHLEAGVFAFLCAAGRRPATDLELFDCLGASLEPHAWYDGAPGPVPVSTTADHIATLANALRACMTSRGVEALDLRCCVVGESAFNAGFTAQGSKAAVSFGAVAGFLREVWRKWGSESPRVAVDRQGGRRHYADLLACIAPDGEAEVRAIVEEEARSVYELVEVAPSAEGAPRRRMVVEFEIGADSLHLPTALASMTAKLVREHAMARFNRHWCARLTDLKPTAGYGADAGRWLHDAAPVITATERRALIRIA